MVRPHELQAFLERELVGRPHARAHELRITSIKDLRAVQTLATLALRACTPPDKRRRDLFDGYLRGFALVPDPGAPIQTDHFEMPNFRVMRSAP